MLSLNYPLIIQCYIIVKKQWKIVYLSFTHLKTWENFLLTTLYRKEKNLKEKLYFILLYIHINLTKKNVQSVIVINVISVGIIL